ncbi:DUF3122 domain-containing protein [Pseudanabaena galeata UHCC 0370]|uniref:DUF3122 domain-containing protein n=1 Tax=Pseudanabaena galeata UHCC 0370 TaxID=3110310 RepID=A0ABU5TRD0_9CYAN|nr:DUF3122 domain-containing protein [Pseudanabaena galeata]MEA5480657.1 DUF3122 domain-containing protein [Pseudanabaena galeata UHCC 0370]
MSCQIRQFFSWLLLISAIAIFALIGFGVIDTPSASAAIRQLEEAPNQMVYQSRQSLKDQHGNTWQTVAFKRSRPDGNSSFELRLVGFPNLVAIDHAQPLTLSNSLGKTLTAIDTSSNIFKEGAQANVGQYDLQPLLSELQAEIPLKISLPTLKGDAISLSVPPALVAEWQTVANY